MSEIFPITKQQEGLWIEWRLHPDNTSYNTCVKLRLEGALDEKRFERALHDVVQFFSSLRVYFIEKNGLPYQSIEEKAEYTLDYLDLSKPGQTKETPEQERQAKEFLEEKLRTPVDLKTFPIVRAGLVKTAEKTHYFIGLVPHIISDGASAILFLESTSIAYNKGYEGLVEAYSESHKDWSDYFQEFEGAHTKKTSKEAAEYWQENMRDAQHAVDFSHGQKAPDNDVKTGKRVYFDLDADLSKKLKDYSRANRTTLFSTLVASFGTLINRYYNQEDLLIGYPVNIRPPGYKYLFGFFVNIIPIRVDLSGDPTFDELVSRVSAARKKDKKHQTFPALDIVREVRKSVAGFDGRVFNVSMAQTVSRLVNLNLDGIKSIPLEAEYNDVNDDLSLSYELLEDGRIGLWIEYRIDLFEPEFIYDMLKHLHMLLKQVAEKPDQNISEYSILDDQERDQILNFWAKPDAPLQIENSTPRTIHGLFERRAQENPDAIALIDKGQKISYAELERRANKQANLIISRRAEKSLVNGGKIALCLERGADMIISLLAVMKAGCAYVPIPPSYPKQRLEFILKDAGCDVVVTHNDLDKNFDGITTPDYIILDRMSAEIEKQSASSPQHNVTADDPAYIIYTSGSTGNPKGVLLNHGNVTPRLHWLQSEIPLSSEDVILQNTDYSFDVSVAEIYWPLMAGATLALTDQENYKDPTYLIELIKKYKVTTTCFVPSLLNSLLAVLGKNKIETLKNVLAAGEALPPTLVKTYYEKCSGTLYNVYGPTEGTIYAAFTKCEKDEELASIPIGRPLGATTLYILDNQKRPVPAGVAGELYIGGVGVAQGYVNLPEMTAERFIPDPYDTENKDAKLYRTGDLVKFKPNGDIDYLGRIDSQVKIRGYRIELAEIEAVISSYQGTEDVAVVDHTGSSNHKRIVAYYVGDAQPSDLKEHIKVKLPEYMQPSLFVSIDTVPRMPSGKINRRALPNPETLIDIQEKYVAPRSKMEKDLVGIWSSILKIPPEKIGIHDSFFDIGGDSLMAIQFACEAEEQGITFETNALFNTATIAELAEIASEGKTKGNETSEAVEGPYPLLPRQSKFFADNFANPHHWNRFFAFDIDHDVDISILEQAFSRVLNHHDNLRICFTKDENGEWQQDCKKEISISKYVFTHDTSDLTQAQKEQEYKEAVNAQHTSLNLEDAPLIRVLHFKTSDTAGKMAVIMHHLLVDMVSSRIIFEDFLKSYEALRNNISLPLPTKTASGKGWSEYLYNLAQTHDFTKERAYWASEKMKPVPSIKTDYPDNKAALDKNAAQAKVILDHDTTQAILRDIPKSSGFSLQDTMLSCLNETLRQWTGQNELLVNICGHGRTGAPNYNLARTVAWVNTVFPVYLEADEQNTSARKQIENTKNQIAAVPKKNEYYNLLRYTKRDPDILKYPTPDVFFNYVSQVDAIIPDGISFTPTEEPKGLIGSDPNNHLCYLLYIEAGIVNKELNIHITYGTDIFKPETIDKFCTLYKKQIEKITTELTGYTEKEENLSAVM